MTDSDATPDIEHPAPGAAPPALPPPPVIEHTPADPVPATPPAAPRPSGGTPLALTLLLFAALAGGLYYVWSQPKNAAIPADPAPAIAAAKTGLQADLQAQAEQIKALAARIDTLEKQPAAAATPAAPAAPADGDQIAALSHRLDDVAAGLEKLTAKVEQQPVPPPVPAAPADDQGQEKQALAQLDERLQKLESRSAQPEPAPAPAPDTSAITALNERVAKLEQSAGQVRDLSEKSARAIMLEAASTALAAGQALGDLPGAPPALARFAKTPAPTVADLASAFPAVAAKTLAASRPDTTEKTFWDRAVARLQQTVTVRQGDHVIVGDPASGIVARARLAVDAGDLKAAVEALSALNGPARAAAQGWIAQAQSLLDARAALAEMAAQ